MLPGDGPFRELRELQSIRTPSVLSSDGKNSFGVGIIGRTAIGRTTIDVLQINRPYQVAVREVLMVAGIF